MVAIIVGLCRRFVSGLSQACPRLGAGLSGFAGLSVLWGLSPLELFVTVVLAHLSGGVGFVRGLSRLCRGLSCPGFAAVCPGFFRGLSRVSRGLLVSCGFGLLQIRHCRGWRGSVEALSWVCVRRGCCRQSSGGGGGVVAGLSGVCRVPLRCWKIQSVSLPWCTALRVYSRQYTAYHTKPSVYVRIVVYIYIYIYIYTCICITYMYMYVGMHTYVS